MWKLKNFPNKQILREICLLNFKKFQLLKTILEALNFDFEKFYLWQIAQIQSSVKIVVLQYSQYMYLAKYAHNHNLKKPRIHSHLKKFSWNQCMISRKFCWNDFRD